MMDYRTCKARKLVKEVAPDTGLCASLQRSSGKKHVSYRLLVLNDDTAGSKISLLYDALRELLEAAFIEKGYKVYNHECYCALLKEVLREHAIAESFDAFRRIRNDINYYGKEVLAKDAKPVLRAMERLLVRLREL